MLSYLGLDINEGGYVYARFRRGSRRSGQGVRTAMLLGHISELLSEPGPLSDFIRPWWSGYLSSIEGAGHHPANTRRERFAPSTKRATQTACLLSKAGHTPVNGKIPIVLARYANRSAFRSLAVGVK
jgi:hypothetical protein